MLTENYFLLLEEKTRVFYFTWQGTYLDSDISDV